MHLSLSSKLQNSSCATTRKVFTSRHHPKRLVALLIFVATITFSNFEANGQTRVQMNFGDQPSPATSRRVILASNQESDFVPKKDQETDPSEEPESSTQKTDAPNLGSTDEQSPPKPVEQLQSDAPVDPPQFQLADEEPSESSPEQKDSPNQEAGEQVANDSYRLPVVADVRAPIIGAPLANVRQEDPSGLLTQDENVNANQRYVDPNARYSSISGMASQPKFKTWQAHDFYHRPLYFEDQNLERAGNRRGFQNAASAAKFFATIPTLPYRIGAQHPKSRVYTYGNGRPGDLIDYRVNQYSGNASGNRLQTLIMLGIILP